MNLDIVTSSLKNLAEHINWLEQTYIFTTNQGIKIKNLEDIQKASILYSLSLKNPTQYETFLSKTLPSGDLNRVCFFNETPYQVIFSSCTEEEFESGGVSPANLPYDHDADFVLTSMEVKITALCDEFSVPTPYAKFDLHYSEEDFFTLFLSKLRIILKIAQDYATPAEPQKSINLESNN